MRPSRHRNPVRSVQTSQKKKSTFFIVLVWRRDFTRYLKLTKRYTTVRLDGIYLYSHILWKSKKKLNDNGSSAVHVEQEPNCFGDKLSIACHMLFCFLLCVYSQCGHACMCTRSKSKKKQRRVNNARWKRDAPARHLIRYALELSGIVRIVDKQTKKETQRLSAINRWEMTCAIRSEKLRTSVLTYAGRKKDPRRMQNSRAKRKTSISHT